jgi:nitric oxide dioxygenase
MRRGARHGRDGAVTPEQIRIVERILDTDDVDLISLSEEFYRRLFEAEPGLRLLFTGEATSRHRKFADQLRAIVQAIRDCDRLEAVCGPLGAHHVMVGVRPHDYRVVGAHLLGALESVLGERWAPEVDTAWRHAYHLVSEAMLAAAARQAPVHRDVHPPGRLRSSGETLSR